MKVDGACLCGQITFEAEVDPETVIICHCKDCQTLSGSAFRLSVPAADGSLRITAGEPSIYEKTAESGNKIGMAFCGKCGSPLYSEAMAGPKIVRLRAAALTQRDELPPKKQIWHGSAQAWVDGIPSMASVEKQS